MKTLITTAILVAARGSASFAPPSPPRRCAIQSLQFTDYSIASSCFPFITWEHRKAATGRKGGDIVVLGMGGFGRGGKKQADLARKLAEAKKQKGENPPADGEKNRTRRMTDDEIKARNDRQRFEDLLNDSSAAGSLRDVEEGGYLTLAQEEEVATAGHAGIDRIYEGDPAPVEPFRDLVNVQSERSLGKFGPEKLLPWLDKNPSRHADCLVVVTDPRPVCAELRNTMRKLAAGLPADVLGKTVVVNADAPAENRRWLKKNDVGSLTIYSDENREFMREYTALGQKRWTMCLFVLRDGRVERIARELDEDMACNAIRNAVKSLKRSS